MSSEPLLELLLFREKMDKMYFLEWYGYYCLPACLGLEQGFETFHMLQHSVPCVVMTTNSRIILPQS